MAVRINSVTFDWADPCRLARFWLQLTGFGEDPDSGNAPGGPEALLLWPDGSLALLFIAVAEPKHVKNRVHLDLVPLPRPSADHAEDGPDAPAMARSGPPPAPGGCRSGSAASSPMAGASGRPRGSPPACLMI